MTHRSRKLIAALTLAAGLGAFTACAPAPGYDPQAPSPAEKQAQELRDRAAGLKETGKAWAEDKLQELEEAELPEIEVPAETSEAPTSGAAYDRDEFGSDWADVDQNGCDQRNDVLARDLTDLVIDGDDCTVLFGTLDDPYTGDVIEFERGASRVDIDHIVALSAAWQMGADGWTDVQREAFANDFDNLNASYMGANRSKGDKTLSEWMPENAEFHCEYATQFVTVVEKYDLRLSAADAAVAEEAC